MSPPEASRRAAGDRGAPTLPADPPPGRPPALTCKVGGSLLDAGRAPGLLRRLGRAGPRLRLLVLPGGGHAVDRIRARCVRGELSEEEAHWAAVRMLDVTALRLAGPREVPAAAIPPATGPGLHVWAPHALLRSTDPLPHSWTVTSDSIAAWSALRMGAGDLLLLKSRDGASRSAAIPGPRRSLRSASRAGLVDAHLPSLVAGSGLRVWILNGRHPDRLLRWLTGDPTAATRLTPPGR